jgi:hypothetical protein
MLLWPAALLAMSGVFLWKNGRTIAIRTGRSLPMQLLDQLRLYIAAGILPPIYYAYELYHLPMRHHARGFLLRSETKGGVFRILKRGQARISLIVSNKMTFAEHFRDHGIPTVPTLAVFQSGRMISDHATEHFRTDLFIKPVVGKGGRGGQRWDYLGSDKYRSGNALVLSGEELFGRWIAKSVRRSFLLQPRVVNHPLLSTINNGALSTVRVLTCLDEYDQPELMGAVMRMAIGSNTVVDNAHAGGIAAAVDLDTGALGQASDLGTSARLGWLERHPTSGAQIEGVVLPFWQPLRSLVEQAHSTLPGFVVLGWDVAILADGPVLIEANSNPGLEIMQRANRRGFSRGRMGELLAHHLATRSRELPAIAV